MTTNRSILEEGPEKKTVALNLKQAEALKKLQQPTGGQDGTDERADLLQQAKETLRQSATPQILWTATVDGKIFGELPGWRTFTGQSTEEAQCDGWTQALHPEDRDHVLRVWREAVQNQTEYNAGYRLRRHDGVYRDFAVHGVPVRLKDGRIRDWVGCCIDITENKRVAESLKLFRALMDQSSDAIEVIDPQTGRFLDVNETAGRRLGYSREEMLCKSVPDIQMDPFAQAFLPESMEEVRRVGVKLLRGWHRRKDGSTFPVEVSVKSICLDRDYLLAIVRDITEQKAVEEKIESQIHELRFWRESSLDREDRIGALKNEVNEALLQGGEAPRYTDPEVLKRDLPPVDLPVLDSEEERLATLRRYSVLDSPAEKDFDDAVALAAQVCGTPFAAISFLDEERQWFKATFGLTITETSRKISFCTHAIRQHDLFVVTDARLDERFAQSPLVTGEMGIRFYAGSPLVAPNGKVLGALCVMDSKPKQITFTEARWLSVLSRHIMALLDLRLQGGEMARANQALLSILEDERRAMAVVRENQDEIDEQKALLDKARDAIVIRDIDGKIVYWNRGAERIHGWLREEVLGRNISKILYPNPKTIDKIYKMFMEKDEWTGEVDHLTKDGREIIVQVHATLIRDNEGLPKSMLEINTDITEKRKIEAQFMRAQRMESIDTLAGGIAHDLNNILSPIMLSIESLQQTSDNPQTQNLLQTIAASAKRGAEVVRQVLSFTQGVEGERVALDTVKLVADLDHIIKDTFPKNIRLKFSILEGTWKIMGDPTQIHQVLLNLCLNARDAMRDGGVLNVGAENCVLDDQYASMNIQAKPGRYVKITVADTGRGLPPAIVDRIFEPFFATQDLDDGTGLRLSTVMAIVKSHGGSINVDSEPGKGTTFNVYLPITERAVEVRKEDNEPLEWPRGKGETILVVDDEASILTVTSQTLIKFGYQVLTATDGANAVSVFAEHQDEISAVLSDVVMPVMDGPAMLHALMEINPSIKVIMASGCKTKSGTTDEHLPGVKYSLTKPYTSATLLTTLRKLLDKP